jgi:pimeloyl-ACP methyl ester carboxylesterase
VLAVWGTADPIVPFAQSKVLLRRAPQTELVPLEGKSHAIAFGEADRIVEILVPFLKRAESRERAAER